ncbi:MAG: hypothetical protein WBE13_10770 [Candidatus Acidiferrum sp.]
MPTRFKRSFCVLIFLICSGAVRCAEGAAWPGAAQTAVAGNNVYPDAASFAAELQRIGNAIEKEKTNPAGLTALREQLPAHWEVLAGEQHYSLSAEPLNTLLSDADGGENPKSRTAKAGEAAEWAFDLASQVRGYEAGQTRGGSSARPALQRILNRREFRSVEGPTAWELFRQRVNRWIEELVLRFFRQVGRYPIGATVLFWLIVVAVVVWLAVMLFRYWTRRASLEELEVPDSVAIVRTWQEWVQAAREAAARGDYREAVHSSYWAGISYLEENEVVRKDRALTPREYMRMVSNSTQLAVTGRKTREALSALTIVLEQAW